MENGGLRGADEHSGPNQKINLSASANILAEEREIQQEQICKMQDVIQELQNQVASFICLLQTWDKKSK